jgi:AcrR family transcriptional regulator
MSTEDPGEPSAPERRVRGKALVAKVLEAALEELARVGYEKLSFEDIAAAAGVNKTTLYRRWSHKRDIVNEALLRFAEEIPAPTDHGSFRKDVVAQLKLSRDLLSRPAIRGLIRLSLGGPLHPDIAEIGNKIHEEKSAEARLVVLRAIARGELPPETDIRLLRSIMNGAIDEIVVFRMEPLSDEQIERIVDMILGGVLARPR